MDDLNGLKQAWDAMVDKQKSYSASELRQIVKKRSKSELVKIQQKILIECTVALLLAVGIFVVIHFKNPTDQYYALIFISIIFLVSFIPYYRVISFRFSHNSNIKSYLSEFIKRFNKLVAGYSRMSAILMPVAVLGGFLLGFHGAVPENTFKMLFTLKIGLIVLIVMALLSIVGHWFQKRYFTWVYGKNIARLNECLADLSEAEQKEE